MFFRPLTKSELMKYADDHHWKAARWVLFILFWVMWLAMLVAAVALIIVAPKCPTPAPKQWWQKAPIYEVYVNSFKDSNNDGFGDLKGISRTFLSF
jgi:neutral and basic amino acid transporter 1